MGRNLLLAIALLLAMLPPTANAAETKLKIKSVDLTLETPQPNMTLEKAEQLVLTSAKTAYGDLLANGVIKLSDIMWDGEFGTDKKGYPILKAGYSYRVIVKIMIDSNSKYTTDYSMKNGDYMLEPDRIKGTINGMTASTRLSAPYFPSFEAVIKVPGGKEGTLKKEDLIYDYEANKKKRRSMPSRITVKEADEIWVGKNALDAITVSDDGILASFAGESVVTSEGNKYNGLKVAWITKVILDMDVNNHKTSDYDNLLCYAVTEHSGYDNLHEIWLSEKVDVAKFITDFNKETVDKLFPDARNYNGESTKMLTGNAVLYIPQKSAAQALGVLKADKTEPAYSVRTYTGDVFAAQKAGKGATKPLACPKHVFNMKMCTADRVCQYPTCPDKPGLYYYSCSVCGKCERNRAHTFKMFDGAHAMDQQLATDQAYVGVNAAGEHVFWNSCRICGMSHSYHQTHLTAYDKKMSGIDGTLELYQTHMKASLRTRETTALIYTTPQADMFTLPRKSDAKMSVWAQNGVNRALCDNLIDGQLLGNDYTKPISRQQLASVATLLVKEMTGKEASAEAIGLDDSALPKSGTVTRQEMAVYIYRALRYIEQHSDYAYSDYNSRLATYTDQAQVKDWAKEAVAFTDALEIVDPKTATTLAPNEACTIETALVAAENATYAHRTGWYQAISYGEKNAGNLNRPGAKNNRYVASSTFGLGDRVWAHRPVIGMEGELPVDEPFTKFRCYVDSKWFHPIRHKADGSYKNSFDLKDRFSVKNKVESKVGKKKKSASNGLIKKGMNKLFDLIK